jgi:hypothetical protein
VGVSERGGNQPGVRFGVGDGISDAEVFCSRVVAIAVAKDGDSPSSWLTLHPIDLSNDDEAFVGGNHNVVDVHLGCSPFCCSAPGARPAGAAAGPAQKQHRHGNPVSFVQAHGSGDQWQCWQTVMVRQVASGFVHAGQRLLGVKNRGRAQVSRRFT